MLQVQDPQGPWAQPVLAAAEVLPALAPRVLARLVQQVQVRPAPVVPAIAPEAAQQQPLGESKEKPTEWKRPD